MSTATAWRHGRSEAARRPAVAGDDPPSTLAGLKRELAPQPGRAANTLRLTVIALLIVAICEALRIPDGAMAAYMAFILFKSDADATIPMAIIGGVAMLSGILVSIVYFAATLSEPALRIPLMAIIAFGAVFLSRASALGPAALVSGLFTVTSLPKGDDLLSGDVSPYNDANVEGPALPSLAYMPPEEALVHNLLWMALAIAVAVAVIVAVDRLTLPDPERKLRRPIADRLSVMASFCAGDDGARHRLMEFARAGTAALSAQNVVAGKLKSGGYRPAFGEGVIRATSELTLLLVAVRRLPDETRTRTALRDAEASLRAAAAAVLAGTRVADVSGRETREATSGQDIGSRTADALERAVRLCLVKLGRALNDPDPRGVVGPGAGLFKPDAFTNLAYRQFAFKVTLALMACYLFMSLADWSSISTCMTTCFVVSLTGIGQSIHKMMLRVSGALIGGAVGFLYILFVMPMLTDLGQLLCAMAPILLLGAWIRTGGERTSYFGQQFAFAFTLVLLQDYGPTLHFQTGRDRVIGILVGELATVVVFLYVWPVSVGTVVRGGVADALRLLAATVTPGDRHAGTAPVQRFAEAVATARGALVDDPYEPSGQRSRGLGPRLDEDVLARLQALAAPISIILSEQEAREPGTVETCDAYLSRLAAWFGRFADWVQRGLDGAAVAASLPRSPDASAVDPRAYWCSILDADLREILALVGLPGSAKALTDGKATASTRAGRHEADEGHR